MSIEQKFDELEKVLTEFEKSCGQVREQMMKILNIDKYTDKSYHKLNVRKLLEDFHVDTFCEQIKNEAPQEQIQKIEEKIGQFQSIIDELCDVRKRDASQIVEYCDYRVTYGYPWYWGAWDSIRSVEEFLSNSYEAKMYVWNIDQQIKDLGTQVYLLKEAKEKIIETQKAVTNPA